MITQVNHESLVEHTGTTYQPWYDGRCDTITMGPGRAGADAVYKAKSALVRNPKDSYGFRPMSPFEGVEQERKQPYGWTANKARPNGCDNTYIRHNGGLPDGIEKIFREQVYRNSVAGVQSHDLLAMRAEADLKQQDINVLQFAAFLPATLKNITSNLKRMDEMLDSLHDIKKLKRLLKREERLLEHGTKRSLYLQWLFVWNQLYRDVVGGARFIRSKSRPIGSLVTGRANNSAENEEVISKRVSSWLHVADAVCTTRMIHSQRAVSVARVTCDINYTYNALGLDNPAYLAWDLVKWSWVVDQIVDIGLFISSLTSLHGLEFLGTSITDRVVNETTVVCNVPPGHAGDWTPGFSRRKHVKRVVRSSPTKTVTIRNPFQNSVMITAAVAAAVSMKAGQSKDVLARLPR